MDRAVLLVDDDKNLLAGMARALRKQPFDVLTAQNGEDAVWLLKTREIDVVVADERMPGLSGGDLLRWVTDNCPNVVRIVLTGHAETETAIRAINETDVFRFFTKPCNEARLAMALHEAVDFKRSMENNRNTLESNRRELQKMIRRCQDLEFRDRVLSEDIERLLERIFDGCRQLEDESEIQLNHHTLALLAEVRQAAEELLQIAGRLNEIDAEASPLTVE